MGLSNIIRSAASQFSGRSGGTTRRTPRTGRMSTGRGMSGGRGGVNRGGSGGVGGILRSILNRR